MTRDSELRPAQEPGVGLMIRPVRPGDEEAVLALIAALAEYEREPEAVETSVTDLTSAFFPTDREPLAHAFVAERTAAAGVAPGAGGPGRTAGADLVRADLVGIAVWFVTFSTWTGKHGIWLEDLFVDPTFRGTGCGRALMRELARECVRRDYARLDWAVLDWNTPAQGFYRSLGARPMDEWTSWRVDGDGLHALAADAAPIHRADAARPAPDVREEDGG